MSTRSSRLALLALVLLPLAVHALSAAFTYQGRLAQGGAAPTGSFDFTFTLYDAATDGAQVGDPVSLPGVAVANGLFTVPLDFGVTPFQGEDRWLEIAVRAAGGPSYAVLAPRQPLGPTPYALFARAVNWEDILNRPAAFGVYTAGPGLTLAGQEFAIANGGVGTPMLSDGAVTAAKLASDAAGLAKVTAGGMRMNGTNVGIGTAAAGFPLGFAATLGDKIALWGDSGAHYGFGVQSGLLQIHVDSAASSIAFGYGSSASFTEGMRIKAGYVGIGTNNPRSRLEVNGMATMTGFRLGTAATTGQVLTADAAGVGTWQALPAAPTTLPPSGAAGGDLTGTYPNPTVGTGKIDSAKILDASIAAADLADGAVTTAKLLDANVTTAKLADGAVTDAKVTDVAWDKITGAPASLPPSGAAGGDLTGTYPNPTIAAGAVANAELASDAASLLKVSGGVMASREGGITIGPDCPAGDLFSVAGYTYTPMGIEMTATNTSFRSGSDPWQSFTATADASLKAVEMLINPEESDTDAQLVIYAGEGTGGAVLGSQAITLEPGFGYRLYTLDTPVALIAGSSYTFALTGVDPWLSTWSNTTNPYAGGRAWYNDTRDIYFRLFTDRSTTGATALMVDRTTLNVGIGTTTPGFPLTFANALGDKISLYGQSGDHYGFGIQGNLLQIHTSASGADIAFGYGQSGALTETVRVKGTGNVGIGTSAPAAKLDVNGTAKMTGFQLGTSATAGQVLTANASGVGSWASLPASLPPSGAAGGDLTGAYPNPTVGTGKIDSGKILDGTIAAADLAANAVTTAKILDASVTTAKLAGGAVTDVKVADVAWGKITGAPGSFPPSGAAGGDLTGAYPTPTIAAGAVANAELAGDAGSLLKVSGGVMTSRQDGITIGPDCQVGDILAISGYEYNPMSIAMTEITASYRSASDPWQSFTATSTTTLKTIEVAISPDTDDPEAMLTVYAGEGTGGAVLGSQAIALAAGEGHRLFTFATPVPLTAGSVYTFAFSGIDPMMSTEINPGNPYAGGRSGFNSAYDIYFRLYSGRSTVASPALMIDRSTLNVGIGTTDPAYPLHVNGRIAGVGTYLNLSDARFKTNIRPLTAALTRIGRLQGVEFDWTRDGTGGFRFDDAHQLGFLAQEVEKVVPEAVTQGADGIYSMSYTTLIPLLVEGMKEQQGTIDAQLRRLTAVEAENAALKARLEKLEAAMAQVLAEKP